MPDATREVLTLAPNGGWIRDGEFWLPAEPFYAVVGDPIAHSRSPAMHKAGLRERELTVEYLPVRVETGELRRLKQDPERTRLAGFNVTSPLKEEAALLCDGRTDAAREVGAVNTVRVEGKRWLGHNTDSGAIQAVLAQAWPDRQPPACATVMGGGGAGRAAVVALAHWGVPSITVRNRGAGGRERLRHWLERTSVTLPDVSVHVEPLTSGIAPAPPAQSSVWVACLPGGLDIVPFLPDAAGAVDALLLDLRYGAQLPDYEPPFGFQRVDGEPVLLLQGGFSFAWWFGFPVPWEAMRSALSG